MKARIGEYRDIPSLLKMAQIFVGEAMWGFTYDEDITINTLIGAITHPDTDIIIVEDGSHIAGGAVVCAERDYCKERLGFIQKFYILPDYRGTLAGRILTKAMCDWFDDRDCRCSFATSTSNISEAAICAYTNLMGKYGYQTCGPVLVRGKNG